MAVLIGVGLFVLVMLVTVLTFNRIKRVQQDLESSFAHIDVQLKRRNDLIPNLVSTIKGYIGHENDTLRGVVNARNAVQSASSSGDMATLGKADALLTRGIDRVMALSESYPELQSKESFLLLQQEIVSTEDKIAYSRQQYNNTVDLHNTIITTIPGIFFTGLTKAEKACYFRAEESERELTLVDFE